MNSLPRALKEIIEKLYKCGAIVKKDTCTITINIDTTKTETNLSKLKPLLYILIRKFENQYSILIKGAPNCLLPEASRYIVYKEEKGGKYRKEKKCKDCKYYSHCPGWKSGHKISPLPPIINNLPNEIVLEITKKCNLSCLLCFSTKSNKKMSLSKIKTITDECADLKIEAIRFSGGEPLLHKDVSEALYYAKRKGLYIILNTNATILNKNTERAIKDCVDNSLVSFQGFDASSEKRLTQNSMDFKKKMHNLVKLNAQIPTFRLGTIISRTLLNNFNKYYSLIRKLGIRHWELYRPMLPSYSEEFKIEKEDFLQLMERIKTIKLNRYDIKIANPLPFCISEDLRLSQYVLLGASADDGHSRIVCDVDGFFKPSYFISENLGKKIDDSWNDPFLQKIRSLNYLPQKCQDCLYLQWCKGGSRSLAKIISGNYTDCDPLMSLT